MTRARVGVAAVKVYPVQAVGISRNSCTGRAELGSAASKS
jgi:hypothetical protein